MFHDSPLRLRIHLGVPERIYNSEGAATLDWIGKVLAVSSNNIAFP